MTTQTAYIMELFAITERYGRSYINLSEVVRLIADGTCTWVVLENENRILTTKNLGYYEKILPNPESPGGNKFFRIHHKHIINLRFLQRYDRYQKLIFLTSQESMYLAQRRVKNFNVALKKLSLY